MHRRTPPGDDRPRHVCDACGIIHYQNPKIVAGCIPEWEERVLLCRRAIEPRSGFWTFPAGYMEKGETTAEAAARETAEEANAEVEIGAPFALFDIPHIDQVYVIYRARLLRPAFSPGHESEAVELFTEAEIPWDQMAFPVIDDTLRLYFGDRRNGEFVMHNADIRRRMGGGASRESR